MKLRIIILILFVAANSVFGQSDSIPRPTPRPTRPLENKQPDKEYWDLSDNLFEGSSRNSSKTDTGERNRIEREIVELTGENFGICTIAYEYRTTCEKLANYNGVDYKISQPPGTKIKIPVTPELSAMLEKIYETRSRAGILFKQGLLNFRNNRRNDAGDDFDQSMEAFLRSEVNLRLILKINGCYNQIIETVYRLEFPDSGSVPQIRSLAAACGWNWSEKDYEIADSVTKMVIAASSLSVPEKNNPIKGFREQKFISSPFDELSRFESISERIKPIYNTKPLSQPIILPKPSPAHGVFPAPVLKNSAGSKPARSKDGKVTLVMNYFNEVLDDPYSMRFVRWDMIESRYEEIPCWRVYVKYRARNLMGAYVLIEHVFYIHQGKIIKNIKLN